MSIRFPWVELLHLPTGERGRCDLSPRYRHMHEQRHMALAVLRSRLWALHHGHPRSGHTVAIYELPDGTPYPHCLMDHRAPVAALEGIT